ncbi:MAG: response regulator [Bacteroidota bacterium]
MIEATITNSKILIIDDQQSNVDVLLDLLEVQGFVNTKFTTNPLLVFDIFKEYNPDLILLDLMMPELSGYEVMEQLNLIIPKTTYLPILILTADISKEAKQQALTAGAKDFLTKPFDIVEVVLRIKNLLETRYLHQQLLNQNQILEEKVIERTSELEKTNNELVIAKNKAEESDRIKSAFLESISIEMTDPLNNILGFSGILESVIEDKEIRGMISTINSSGTNLLNITNDIFNIISSDKSSFELNKQIFKGSDIFLESRINLIEILNSSNNKRKINLVFSPDYGLLLDYITADKNKISQVLNNIFRYSVKYFEKGNLEFGFYKYDLSKIIFYVKNTGIGVSKVNYEDLSDLFRLVDNSKVMEFDGTKIGLAISKRIAEAMNAEIRFESTNNEATFYFQIPVEISFNEVRTEEKIKKKLIPDLSGKNILIAENDEPSLQLIKLLLHPTKVNVFECTNGFLAIKEFKKQENIDLIIMNNRMPIIDGLKATRAIKKIKPSLPIIAITSYLLESDKIKVLKSGCDDVITKPINKIPFYNTLSKHLLSVNE